nr:UTP--glucose-1-phosphate uridylyltransferase [Tanacetum cinerariifolium]
MIRCSFQSHGLPAEAIEPMPEGSASTVVEHFGGPEILFDSHEDDTPDVLKSRPKTGSKGDAIDVTPADNRSSIEWL